MLGSYVKPLSSSGPPQLACSPGVCRFIMVFILHPWNWAIMSFFIICAVLGRAIARTSSVTLKHLNDEAI